MEQTSTHQTDATMGRVNADVKLTNDADRTFADEGVIEPSEIREIEVEFLVDTGAAFLCLPAKLIHELGLRKFEERPSSQPTAG